MEMAFVGQEMMMKLICFGEDSNLDITIGLFMGIFHFKMTLDPILSLLMMLIITWKGY
ncbi:hypothetical protein MA16_Dca025868 [Dendrobium catenatum]|uniref:Uncharacterized protein n=1 Tax=Dendrobium catenatum TaxID=906689 RepID=A0A2I0WWD2_9ASPA|nr:hypothetical protein MA16_Dca025868 [Dendrobium catenatum]